MPSSPPPLPPHRPLQFAFSPAGTETCHFACSHLYDAGNSLSGHDGVNTFNTIDRTAGATALRACPHYRRK
jgi:hypothetical protein